MHRDRTAWTCFVLSVPTSLLVNRVTNGVLAWLVGGACVSLGLYILSAPRLGWWLPGPASNTACSPAAASPKPSTSSAAIPDYCRRSEPARDQTRGSSPRVTDWTRRGQ